MGTEMDRTSDYRELLKAELSRRQEMNSSYSARAFARDLGVSAAFLVQLFAKRKNLSEMRATSFVEKLAWDADVRKKFWQLYRVQRRPLDFEKNDDIEPSTNAEPRPKRELAKQEFALVSDWHHYAVIELLKHEGGERSIPWLARRLGLQRAVVERSLLILTHLGLVRQDGETYFAADGFYTSGDVPSAAIRRNHRQHLELAREALELQSLQSRNFSGITVSIDPSRLPEASERIREFRRNLMQFLESGEKKQVYRLNIQLFRLDRDY